MGYLDDAVTATADYTADLVTQRLSRSEPGIAEPDELLSDDAYVAKPWVRQTVQQAVPFPVAALLWGAAEAAHLAPDTWPIGAPAATAVYFVAAIGVWTAWARNHPDNRAARRRWATTVITTSGTWLLWAASAGVGHVATVLLTLGGTALALPYWTRNSVWQPRRPAVEPDPDPEPDDVLEPEFLEVPEAPEPEPVELPDPRTANQMHWDGVVAVLVPAVAGSTLTDPMITDDFEQYTGQLVPGKQTTRGAMAAAAQIASAYGLSFATIGVLPHPSGDQDKFVIRFAKANTLAKSQDFPVEPAQAIDLTGGNLRVLFAFRSDGSPVWWTFYLAEWGALGGAVFGDTGSGKSVLLRVLITLAAYTGLIVPIVACPQGGASYPMWMQHGHWPAASGDVIMRQARALLAAHTIRSIINKLKRRDVHPLTPDAPLLIWVIDEFHKMAEHPDAAEFHCAVDTLEREGRKTGIRLVVSDQDPSVPKTFGNLMTIRRSLLSAQCYTLRLASNVASQLPGMQVDPTTLPQYFPDGSRAAGLGAVVGEAELSRVVNLRTTRAWELAAAAPTLTIEPAVANRMGEDYRLRFERNLEDDGDAVAELERFDPQLAAELIAENPELGQAAEEARLRAERRVAAERTTAAAAMPDEATPASVMPRPRLIPVPSMPMCRRQSRPASNWTCVEKIEQVMRAGATRFGAIWDQARRPDGQRYSETAVRKAIAELIDAAKVIDAGYGKYHYQAA